MEQNKRIFFTQINSELWTRPTFFFPILRAIYLDTVFLRTVSFDSDSTTTFYISNSTQDIFRTSFTGPFDCCGRQVPQHFHVL